MEAINIPALKNASLLRYVQEAEVKYPGAEFYKEELRDTGRGEGPSLGISICKNDEILEEENFYYPSHEDLLADLSNLIYYLDFA
jgi:hypothetical protein